MLTPFLGKSKGKLLNLVERKTRHMMYSETVAYKGAFLTSVREKLLPYYKGGVEIDPQQEEDIIREVYDEVNDLFIDEHWMISNGDLLEQTFAMLSPLKKICTHNKLKWYTDENYDLMHPNDFQIHLRSEDLVKEEKSLWEVKPELLDYLKKEVGHIVEYKQSNIDHHEAGDGIFVKTHNGQSLLPGTLLGFYPGVIRSQFTKLLQHNEESMNFNIKRYDSFWIDSEALLPYPAKQNLSLSELKKSVNFLNSAIGGEDCIEFVDPEYLNPYAIGHKINHPPPEVAANAELVDFDIPYTWFPEEYRVHLPYIDEKDFHGEESIARKNILRGVAVLASRFIEDGEEIYFDYLKQPMAWRNITEDWLVLSPPSSPLLQKKKLTTEVPLLFKIMLGIRDLKLGEKFDTWYERIEAEPPSFELKSRKKVTKSVKERLALKQEEEQKRISEGKQDEKE
ncbi:unnamed protein product [Moneuplotes crassus]|uniref:SET domain-containing protein n=1 Tax=Euplotes crassus TaxID=5936 RepID=A0AAD1UH89_EUPCR|nr:unnamed protein product [Moneuplotes crassus]